MILVIDTNVLVSAVLRDRDPEAVLLFAAETAGVRWVATPEIMTEYRAVLGRPKFALPSELLARWYAFLDQAVEVHASQEAAVQFPRDRKDAMFLACALAAGAHFLVTGDRDFAEPGTARRIASTTIISVSTFKRLVGDRYGRQ
jgi:uncharacterized protein